MHRWSDGHLARPAGRGGRAFHRQSFLHHWIFPYAMIPVPNHSRQPTTHSTIRPRWRIPHRWWSSTYHRRQIKKPKPWSAVFSYPAFYLEILSLQSLGTETYCTPVAEHIGSRARLVPRDCRRKQRVFRRIVHQFFPHAAGWMDAPRPAIPVIKLLRCMWTRSI
jgi:hypothetical protein